MLAKPIVRWLLPFVVVGGSYAGYAAIAATAPEKESTKETMNGTHSSSLFSFSY